MAASQDFLSFVLDQLSGLDGITHRAMMGEYILYYHGKIAAYLCDDRLLVKPVPSAVRMMPNARLESPYEGASAMLLVNRIDDRAFLHALFTAMLPELPEPKPKPIRIKTISKKQLPAALSLVWRVFLEFEAPDYPPAGVDAFRRILGDDEYISQLRLYGAFDGTELAGVLAMREPQHISLFFVDADYHRRGIGTRLFRRMKKDYDSQRFTVHASPYALPFYRSLGFRETDCEQISDGIRYTPMEYHPAKE